MALFRPQSSPPVVWLLFSLVLYLMDSDTIATADGPNDQAADQRSDCEYQPCIDHKSQAAATDNNSAPTPDRKKTASTEHTACSGDLIVVYRLKSLFCLQNGKLVEDAGLPSRTWMRATGEPVEFSICDCEPSVQSAVPVRLIGKCCGLEGWITLAGTVNVTRLKSTLASQRTAFPLPDNPDDHIPALVLRQPADLQQAWQEAELAIRENGLLPESEQSAEPWLARGEIQALAGNYHGALSDYVEASRFLKRHHVDPQTHASAFQSLSGVLQRLPASPVPPVVAGHLEEWERGYYAWRRGNFVIAAQAFQNATELGPREPVYWYFRALTYREIGLPERALHDARIGAWLENQLVSNRSFHRYVGSVSHRLEPVQGPDRQWLERQRRGYQRRAPLFPH